MTTATLTAQQYIQSCIDVNSSWAEDISVMGIIASLDMDLCLEGSIFADCVAEEFDISEEEAIAELTQFVCQNYLAPSDWVATHLDDVLRICLDEYNASPQETVEALFDLARREDNADIIVAIFTAAAGHDYEEEIMEAMEQL